MKKKKLTPFIIVLPALAVACGTESPQKPLEKNNLAPVVETSNPPKSNPIEPQSTPTSAPTSTGAVVLPTSTPTSISGASGRNPPAHPVEKKVVKPIEKPHVIHKNPPPRTIEGDTADPFK